MAGATTRRLTDTSWRVADPRPLSGGAVEAAPVGNPTAGGSVAGLPHGRLPRKVYHRVSVQDDRREISP